jgi:ankyrin repeat protein
MSISGGKVMSRLKKGLISLVVMLAVVGIAWAIAWFVVFKKDSNLLKACRECDAGKVRALLERGADPNAQEKKGWRRTALMLAAICDKDPEHRGLEPIGDPEIVKFLLEKGADVNRTSLGGGTALHLAVGRSRSWKGKNEGAPPYYEVRGLEGERIPLPILAHEAPGNPEIIRLLLAAGADVNAGLSRERGWTPLTWAMMLEREQPCLICKECVRLLIERGATSFNGEKCDYMDRAVECHWDEVVELYIQRGCPRP